MSLYLVQHQARSTEPTPYEHKLAGAIEDIFGEGNHGLEALVEGLNERGMHAPSGQPWTAETFEIEIARMGAQ